MSGFEGMSSHYNQLLHPTVDKKDNFDPTFLGVTRKRRAHAPPTEFMMEERGKRIHKGMSRHQPENITQLDSQYTPETFKGDTKSTRFGKGFNRRPASLICHDAKRKTDEEFESKVKAEKAEHRRQKSVVRGSAFNPVTGEEPIVSKYYPLDASQQEQRNGAKQRASCKAVSPLKWQSSVFKDSTSHNNKGASSAQVMGDSSSQPLSRRQQLLKNEGLTHTKKEWGVAEQMSCYDGFVLPSIQQK